MADNTNLRLGTLRRTLTTSRSILGPNLKYVLLKKYVQICIECQKNDVPAFIPFPFVIADGALNVHLGTITCTDANPTVWVIDDIMDFFHG